MIGKEDGQWFDTDLNVVDLGEWAREAGSVVRVGFMDEDDGECASDFTMPEDRGALLTLLDALPDGATAIVLGHL